MNNPMNAIHALLTGDATVNGIVSGGVYPVVIPESGTIPAVVVQFISKNTTALSGADCPLVSSRMQVTCIAEDYEASFALASAVDDVLKRYGGTEATIVIQQIFTENGVSDSFAFESQPGVNRWAHRQDYEIFYEE